jgi:energy-converting hydrogenase Eha subunit B
MVALLMFGMMYYLVGAVMGTPIAFLTAWVGEKITSGKEPGFAVHWVAAHATGVFAKMLAQSWKGVGLMAPPNHQRIYEP